MKKIMHRRFWLAAGLSLAVVTSASAEVYRCRNATGQLVMTDNRANLPAGCTPIDQPAGAGSFNVVPAPPTSSPGQPPAPDETAARPDQTTETTLKAQALALTESYHAAVTKRYHASLVTEQKAAMREIAELIRQKQEMLDGLAGSGLSAEERKAVRHILDGITSR